MPSKETKNDRAWKKLFEKYNILEKINKDGYFEITSTQINEFREARLMTKFDNQKTLPNLFKEHKISILPKTSSSYILANFSLYEPIQEISSPIEYKEFPSYIESIDYNHINSEAIALNCAYISRIFNDFLENDEDEILPAVDGKMNSGKFTFVVNDINNGKTHSVSVDRAGIEIDAGYESSKDLVLIEAKNVIADDFLIRQLYYPFRLWKDKVSKKVRTLFMQYSNGIFNLYEYEFKEPNNYNSLVLIKSKRYGIISQEEMEISFEDINLVYENISFVKEPEIPFPQADSFKRVITLLEMLDTDSIKTKDEITEEFQFDPRQTDYYFNAGKYLGFLEEDEIVVEEKKKSVKKRIIKLTKRGKHLFEVNYKNRQLEFARAILEHKVFYKVFEDSIDSFIIPEKTKIIEYMQNSNLYNLNRYNTYKRRSQTVSGWVNWILSLCE